MSEEFSKLSLKSKSIITSQTMTWTIPQSRLNQQCPFLEKEFPYFTTDFSFLHFSSPGLELKWRLVLEKKGDFVTINLINTNNGAVFERKEMKNVELRWTLLHQTEETEISILEESPAVSVDFQTLRFGTPKGCQLCKVEDFESFAHNGRFTFDIKIFLEFFQEKKKFSIIQQAKKLSDSISEISSIYSKSSKSRTSVLSKNRSSVQSNSWVGKSLPNIMANTLSRKSSFSQPTYQCSRAPSPPRISDEHCSFPSTVTTDYQYQDPVYRNSEEMRSFSLINKLGDCDSDLIRRTKSGRLPSVVGHLSRADDTLDSMISGQTDTVFLTPLKHSTVSSQEVKGMFKCLPSTTTTNFLASRARPQLSSTPQSQPLYSNSPTVELVSPTVQSNSLHASQKLTGRSSVFSRLDQAEGSRQVRSVWINEENVHQNPVNRDNLCII